MDERERGKAVVFGSMLYEQVPALSAQFETDYRFVRLREDASVEQLTEALVDADALVTMVYRGMPAAPRLRLLQVAGAGIDLIDLEALPETATVCNAFGHEVAVAEYAMLAMLLWPHEFLPAVDSFREGSWRASSRTGAPLHGELSGKTVGILGLGRIGRELALRAHAFGCRVFACTEHETADGIDELFRRSELHEFMRACDFVVVACRLSAETDGIVDGPALAAMGPEAVLVNVARGECVDEEALYHACANKTIRGAVVDVWYQYPSGTDPRPSPSRFPFAGLPNVLMTPHSAAWTREMLKRRLGQISDNLRRLARGLELHNVVRKGHHATSVE